MNNNVVWLTADSDYCNFNCVPVKFHHFPCNYNCSQKCMIVSSRHKCGRSEMTVGRGWRTRCSPESFLNLNNFTSIPGCKISKMCVILQERFLIGVRKMLLHFQLPLLRWKRFAVVAAMCIFAVRAVIVQIAFYLHIQVCVNCYFYNLCLSFCFAHRECID